MTGSVNPSLQLKTHQCPSSGVEAPRPHTQTPCREAAQPKASFTLWSGQMQPDCCKKCFISNLINSSLWALESRKVTGEANKNSKDTRGKNQSNCTHKSSKVVLLTQTSHTFCIAKKS
uniref:Uncharacterized protein n=1 Tax=Mandrillus leucophaeus TaxID=9568 RepID=A0A2K5XQF6_MANLE